jgi:hypothetical protein
MGLKSMKKRYKERQNEKKRQDSRRESTIQAFGCGFSTLEAPQRETARGRQGLSSPNRLTGFLGYARGLDL